jgi:DNA repair protein RadC
MSQATLFDVGSVDAPKVKRVPRYEVRLVRNATETYHVQKVGGAHDACRLCVELVRSVLDDATAEKFVVISLDTQHRPIGFRVVTEGTLDASIVHPREVFQFAVLTNASAILLCHNHPSGDLTPSREDIAVTKRLKDAGEMMGIRVLDHIIVGNDPVSGDFRGVSLAEKSWI